MTRNPPSTGVGIADELLPLAARRGMHALWQAEGSRQYIENAAAQTDAYLDDLGSDIATARIAYEDAVGAFTGEEVCVLADRLDAKKQAADHLPTTPTDVPKAADAVTTLFQKSVFIATESAGSQFQQRVSEAETVREEARSMVGGTMLAANEIHHIASFHTEVDRSAITLPSYGND